MLKEISERAALFIVLVIGIPTIFWIILDPVASLTSWQKYMILSIGMLISTIIVMAIIIIAGTFIEELLNNFKKH